MIEEKWKNRYFHLAWTFSQWSKDPSTKVGAVAIGEHGQILSAGYNGLPRGIKDTDLRLSVRKVKYDVTVHAEMNLIYNASLTGISLKDSLIFTHGLPVCSSCVLGLIQAKVGGVFVLFNDVISRKTWEKSWKRSRELLNEAGIYWEEY